ncbi:transglutaminase domain-containing protein [Planctomycetota bacterium]|nr:transglutaminase domain-containing protein [Planctomycetota bacterium]
MNRILYSMALAAFVALAFSACKSSKEAGDADSGETACSSDSAKKTPAKKAAVERTGKDRWGDDTLTFDAVNSFTLNVPEGAGTVQAWFAMPQKSNADQVIKGWAVDCDHDTNVVKDQHGNEFLHLTLKNPSAGEVVVKTSFKVIRHELSMPTDASKTRPHTDKELAGLEEFLTEQTKGAVTPGIEKLAKDIVGSEDNPLKAARLIYDGVLDHMEYWVKDPANLKSSGSGNAAYAFEKCTGNCTDFHSLYHAICMSVKLPCRTVYGSLFKTPLDGQDKDQSYHCWLEVHAPNVGWVPLDVAVGDIFVEGVEVNDANREKIRLTVADDYTGASPELVDYYFGNLDARRVVWHEHRDLKLKDAKAESINYIPWYYVEVDGQVSKICKRKLTFNEVK